MTVGAGALIHAATLRDGCVVGEAAQVLDGAVVEEGAMVAPASIVTPGTKVPAAELWSGSPAKLVRTLTAAEQQGMSERAVQVASLAAEHAFETSKDYKQILEEEELADIERYMDKSAPQKPERDMSDVQGQGHPGRIFRSTLSHPEDIVPK